MDVKIPEDVLYEMVELLVEPKYLKPSENECVLHLDKRDRLLDQLLVLRRKALASKKGVALLNGAFPIKSRAAQRESAIN